MKTIFTLLSLSVSIAVTAQLNNLKYTYNNSNTEDNYIDYDQIEELTQTMLEKNTKYFDESEVSYLINLDRSQLPNYTSQEIHSKMQAIPTTINLRYTPEVGKLIDVFAFNKRGYLTRMMTLSQDYFPIFESVLQEKNLPLELKYLPIVESALNPNAVSRCGATGLWQFMYTTAKGQGVEINSLVDNRRDIYHSTVHAADYLKSLHDIYGDWLLALAAYNAGPGNVNKAIRLSGGSDFWTIKHRLPRETQNYVPSFMAMVYIMHYHNDYKILPGKSKFDFYNTSVEKIYDKTSLRFIAELVGTTEEDLRQYNPSLIKGIVPATTNGFKLVLPYDMATKLAEKKGLLALDPYINAPAIIDEPVMASAYTPSSSRSTSYSNSSSYKNNPDYRPVKSTVYKDKTSYHKVRRGETLTSVARKFGVSKTNLAKWNKLSTRSRLIAGKSLKVKRKVKSTVTKYVKIDRPAESTSTSTYASNSNNSNSEYKNHTVQRGETLLELTRQYNVGLNELKEWNNLSSNSLYVGQNIRIKKPDTSLLQVNNNFIYYQVNSGDTLQTASSRLNIPVELLKSLNDIDENQLLNEGDKIKVPTVF